MNKPLILVVEDDPAVARLISTTLETQQLSVPPCTERSRCPVGSCFGTARM